MRLAIVRTGQVMETGGGILGELLPPLQARPRRPARGRQAVAALDPPLRRGRDPAWALDTESASGVVNGTAPNPVTNKDWSKALGRALGRPAVLPIPGLAVEVEIRQGVRQGRAGRPAGAAAADRGARLRLQVPGDRRSAAGPRRRAPGTCFGVRRGGSAAPPELRGQVRCGCPRTSTASMIRLHALRCRSAEVSEGMPADSRIERVNLVPGPGASRSPTALVSGVARRELEPSVARSTPPPPFTRRQASGGDLEVPGARPVRRQLPLRRLAERRAHVDAHRRSLSPPPRPPGAARTPAPSGRRG